MTELLELLAGWLFPFWVPPSHAARCQSAARDERDALQRLTRAWSAAQWAEMSRRLTTEAGRPVTVTSLAGLLPHVSVPVTLGLRSVRVACANGASAVRYTPEPGSLRLERAALRRLIAAVQKDAEAAALAARSAQFMKREQDRAQVAEREAAAGLARHQASWATLRRTIAQALAAGEAARAALGRRRARLAAAQQALQAAGQTAQAVVQELEIRQERRRVAAEAIFEPGHVASAADAQRLAALDKACAEQLQALDRAEAAMQAATDAIATEQKRIAAARDDHAKAAARLRQAKSDAARLAATLRDAAQPQRDAAAVAAETDRILREATGLGSDGPALLAQLKALDSWTLTPAKAHSDKRRHLRAVDALRVAVEAESGAAALRPLAS